ncbi:hypothetical protein ACLI4Z_05725 [Natrialbaceae archaeon A-arb3/5]
MAELAPDERILETARNDPARVDVETVVALFDARQGQVRNVALRCLLFVAQDDPDRVAAVNDRVIERLDDEFPVAGSTAAGVLARIARERPDAVHPARSKLVSKLDENPPLTGYRAARALVPLLEDDPAAFVSDADALLDVLVDPPDVWAPDTAELREMSDGKRQEITNRLSSRRDEIGRDKARTKGIREFVAHAIVEVSEREPDALVDRIDELAAALSIEPAIARAAIIDAIANVASAEPAAVTPTVDALVDRLEDDAEFVRAHAVRALGFAEATEAVEPLRTVATADVETDLRELAAETADWIADSNCDE